ncbi:hypothetical protein PSACC_01524 [Paramicrosporidium saccamoebae]|uniref:Uncharacterized protein n=1 Tax=Paramicrosporidium saccamoebae TaxID=1246581 RepID=A0A2H9TLY3_9FUNG|nr:hypothetical protein PSACC_01524 [Paramicrosporidium saccamoebae]
MYKLVAFFLALAFLSCASAGRNVPAFVSSIISDNAELHSSILSQISAQTTFTGEFTEYESDLSSLVSSILATQTTTETESSSTSSSSTTETSENAARQNFAGLAGMVAAFVGSLAMFYML